MSPIERSLTAEVADIGVPGWAVRDRDRSASVVETEDISTRVEVAFGGLNETWCVIVSTYK